MVGDMTITDEFDPDQAGDHEPQPAADEALAEFNRELQAAINEEFSSQPF
jgi:hypothetical protein